MIVHLYLVLVTQSGCYSWWRGVFVAVLLYTCSLMLCALQTTLESNSVSSWLVAAVIFLLLVAAILVLCCLQTSGKQKFDWSYFRLIRLQFNACNVLFCIFARHFIHFGLRHTHTDNCLNGIFHINASQSVICWRSPWKRMRSLEHRGCTPSWRSVNSFNGEKAEFYFIHTHSTVINNL